MSLAELFRRLFSDSPMPECVRHIEIAHPEYLHHSTVRKAEPRVVDWNAMREGPMMREFIRTRKPMQWGAMGCGVLVVMVLAAAGDYATAAVCTLTFGAGTLLAHFEAL